MSEVDLFLEAIPKMRDLEKGQPATEEAIAAFEERYGVRLPADVREFFLKINGANGWFFGIEALDKWCSLEEYIERWAMYCEVESPQGYYCFGHYDILVWTWVIQLSSDPEVETPVYVIFKDVRKIANSFSDFLYQYRTGEPEDLLGYYQGL